MLDKACFNLKVVKGGEHGGQVTYLLVCSSVSWGVTEDDAGCHRMSHTCAHRPSRLSTILSRVGDEAMDELVHHCLRELSFDGDLGEFCLLGTSCSNPPSYTSFSHIYSYIYRLGCNVSRLREFIAGFYASQHDYSQLVDDPFCAFVWSIVVQQPSVRVGTLPPGLISEVYIAPQTSAKRKAAAKGEELVEGVPPSLVLVEDARHRHLQDLKGEYGDNLRIAVDPETSFTAITGSHIKVRVHAKYINVRLICS